MSSMDDPRISWWLIVLVGTGVAGLAVWQSSRWTLQLRLGAGALALVYMAMLAIAVGGNSRTAAANWRGPEVLAASLCGVSLLGAMLLIGRPSERGQLIWFALMSLANAGVCIVTGNAGIAIALTLIAIPVVGLLALDSRRPGWSFSELWPSSAKEAANESPYVVWLAGAAGFLIAVLLIGTSHYALHAESSRATTSRRHSALPTRTRLRTVLEVDANRERSTSLMDLATGRRADITLLLAVLVFVSLATSISKPGAAKLESDPR